MHTLMEYGLSVNALLQQVPDDFMVNKFLIDLILIERLKYCQKST